MQESVSEGWPGRRRAVITEHAGLSARGLFAHVFLTLCHRVGWIFRRKRLARFDELFPADTCGAVLDVGGTFSFWEGANRRVTIVNPLVNPASIGNLVSLPGDGRALPFADKSFPLVFSNSAIEHMSREDMRRFAGELSRVGMGVYCQTPNRWFPYDTHYIACFWHWWPQLLHNYYIARYLTGWGWIFKPDRKAVEDWANEVNLIGRKDFAALFPDCTIERETFLGMTKSFMAVRTLPGTRLSTEQSL